MKGGAKVSEASGLADRHLAFEKGSEGIMIGQRMFQRYIGVDYSGAATATERKSGLAVCSAVGDADPKVDDTFAVGATRWTRAELAHMLVNRLLERDTPTLVGIDHAFSFPIDYFDRYLLPRNDWGNFLEDFQGHWPTDEGDNTVGRIQLAQQTLQRNGQRDGHRLGEPNWFRLTDRFSRVSSSVFDFEAMGRGVAHQTHAGLPWLLYIRRQLGGSLDDVNFWPFDHWDVTPGQSVVVEVYPALWSGRFERVYNDSGGHRHDAYSIAKWMSETDRNGILSQYFRPRLTDEQNEMLRTEGWIFGVLGNGRTDPI